MKYSNKSLISLKHITDNFIKILPSRSQDILKRRFGLGNKKPQTLQAIGKNYGITRERVRQIVEYSLATIIKSDAFHQGDQFWQQAAALLKDSGGAEEEQRFWERIKTDLSLSNKERSMIKFLLVLTPDIILEKEGDFRYSFWYLSSQLPSVIQSRIKSLENYFKKKQKPLPLKEILLDSKKIFGQPINEGAIAALLRISKKIGMNPFQEYGLLSSSQITPQGTRDRAYVILRHYKQPSHFTDISKLINKSTSLAVAPTLLPVSWMKQVRVQTVHNELIKDQRFVLIGRGVYALKDWGYQAGKVVDIIKNVLRKAKRPLSQDKIIEEVKKQRLAKEATIILNLHNNKFFRKLSNNKYTLAKSNKP